MIELLSLIGMLYLHIVDDYYLQGFLASAKQKDWWKKNYPEELYKNDYIIALIEHAFSWTVAIMSIPAISLLYNYRDNNIGNIVVFSTFFIFNWIVHFIIDNMKANEKSINLITDQTIHILQVFITWFLFIILL